MYDWLPGLCIELRGNLTTIYWILIVPLTTFLIILEYFKLPDRNPNIANIIKRAVISMILLASFEECARIISFVGDGIVARIGGMNSIHLVLQEMWKVLTKTEVSWIHFKELVIFVLSLLSYIAAYLGAFVADALIHFCWAILYVASPLMILAYIPESLAGTCKNLYRCLCTIVCWKILWAILGALLLKLSTSAPIHDGNDYNAILVIIMNLFIGLSMLFVPLATKSLIGDGLSGFASGLAAIPALATQKVMVHAVKHTVKRGAANTWRATGLGAKAVDDKTGKKSSTNNGPQNANRQKWQGNNFGKNKPITKGTNGQK